MASPLDGMDEEALALLSYLEGRRVRTRAAAARRATRALTPTLPRASELALEAFLMGVSQKISRAIDLALAPDLERARAREAAAKADALEARMDADLVGLFSRSLLGDLEIRIGRIVNDPRIPSILDQHGRRLNQENAKEMNRILGISPETDLPRVAAALRTYRQEIADLIKSIGRDQLGQVRDLVAEAGASGMRVETLAAQIQERFTVSASRARLIARDQTLKANSRITRTRQEDAGVLTYRWSTSKDGKVRDTHEDLEGTIQKWAEPPVTNDKGDRNHPGEDIQCRCVAIPILPP